MELEQYCEALSTKQPVPGGGSATAYVGSLATALLQMSCHLTIGKKKYQQYEEEIKNNIVMLEENRQALINYMKLDEQSFLPLSEAYKTKEGIEECLLNALVPPIESMKVIVDIIKSLDNLKDKLSKLMLSDIACSAALAHGALLGCQANIKANTRLLKNKELANKYDNEAKHYVEVFGPCAMNIYNTVIEEMSNG